MNRGFSLVELSVVLVILGLLTGGILGGQALIRASELRSVGIDMARYTTAMYAFRDQYRQLPGDFTTATRYWGDQATGTEACPDAGTTNGNPGTCNGNGDNLINIGAEGHRAWQQLALNGLIDGVYTGYNGGGTGCGSICDSVAGVNVPRLRVKNGGISIVRTGQDPVGDAAVTFSTILSGPDYNSFIVGTKQANFYYDQPLLTAEEAWGIDTKIDDGKPQYGKVYPFRHTACTTSNDPATADYNLTNKGVNCVLLHKF